MLAPWLEADGATALLNHWSELINLDLVRLGTTAEAEEITDTAITQPLVVASALLAHSILTTTTGELPAETIVAGHSVGELAAAAIAGVITADEAITLAAARGREMAQACALEPTTMAAVLGGDESEVLARLTELNLTPANRNAVGQIVAAGAVAAIDELIATPPEKARIRKLAVAGAFHTDYMAPAQAAVARAAERIIPHDPRTVLLSNFDGQAVTSGPDALDKIIKQVTRPVRWDLCSVTMRELGTTAIFELPPAGALVGIAKRELKGVPTTAIKVPDDLAQFA